MPVNQETNASSLFIEASDHTWHQVADNYQVANSNTKAFNGNGRVKYNSCIWVCDLRESEKGSSTAVQISGALCLKVETKACSQACP